MGARIGTGPATQARLPLGTAVADPFFAEALFDRLPDVVFFVKNRAGQYVVVNDTLVERCGARSKADVVGRTAEEVFPAPLGTSYALQDRSIIDSGKEIRDRLELHLFRDRSRGWCLTHKIPLFTAGGAIAGMAGLSRDLHSPDEGRAGYRGLANAIDYLGEHYAGQVRVEDLARVSRLPVERFHRLVKRVFQITPGQLVIKTRVDAAARLLAETDGTVAAIAHACGYSDHSAFTRQFGSATGLTPTQFRERLSVRLAEK